MRFQLSIVIPTWNRLAYLKENISRIIEEVEKQKEAQIEIFISDNCSDDGTKNYLKTLATKYDYVNINLYEKNTGANHNFYTVFKESSGDYIWLLGDDDMIVESALEKIIHDIKMYQPGILIGGTVDDVNSKRVYLKKIVNHELIGEEILNRFNAIELAGKMSVLIFARSALMNVLNEGMLQINKLRTPWPHLIWFLKAIARGNKILILPYPTNYIIKNNRYNNLQDGKERLSLLFVDYSKLLIDILPDFSKSTQKNLIRNLTKGRCFELIKNIAYSSFMNGYRETIIHGISNIKYFSTFKNKMSYLCFYLIPVLFPVKVRLWCFKLPVNLKLNFTSYIDFINYLEKAKDKIKIRDSRSIFNRVNL